MDQYERNRKIIILENATFPKITATGINDLLTIHRDLIAIRIEPTYQYLSLNIENNDSECYSNYIKDIGAGIDEMRVHEDSKFKKIATSYEKYDIEVSEIKSSCPDQCSICCGDIFYISDLEYLYILASLMRKRRYKDIYKIYHKARLQSECLKENYLSIYHQMLDNYCATDPRYYNLGFTLQCQVSCPVLNDTGKCAAYDSRPGICRKYGTTTSCAIAGNKDKSNIGIDVNDAAYIFYKGEALLSQPRPMWYWSLMFLSKENLFYTKELIKSFVKNDEDKFFEDFNKIFPLIDENFQKRPQHNFTCDRMLL